MKNVGNEKSATRVFYTCQLGRLLFMIKVKKFLIISLCIIMLFGLNGYGKQLLTAMPPANAFEDDPPIANITDYQARNLQKLCKVWGFAKYTHNSFLLGLKDWDEELLSLIPVVQFADEDIVNNILYDWFVGLGDDGYGLGKLGHHEMNLRQMADMNWINNDYLGQTLAAALLRFNEIHIPGRVTAPVSFNQWGNSTFFNEKSYINMDFKESGYRLLGLFRLWNAIEYYFPYRDILDKDWNALLLEYIPKILEGVDRLSYELALASISSNLHDAHVHFARIRSELWFFCDKFGSYIAPARLVEAEGRLVVSEIAIGSDLFELGDAIIGMDGKDIEETIDEMLQYLSWPNEEKALAFLARHDVLRSVNNEIIQVDILRDGVLLSLDVLFDDYIFAPVVTKSHELLQNNIGLINPAMLSDNYSIPFIMAEFAETDGIIIDMRQYPRHMSISQLYSYFVEEWQDFIIFSLPFQQIPGVFYDKQERYSISRYMDNESFYKNKVVVLMNDNTQSAAETIVMSLRTGPNVTVIGGNSIGANGNITRLPLPGGIYMGFSGLGVYTAEGGQTQRIGLSPDICSIRTIAGIREGRDELKEKAIQFILSQ